jgi:hypothetical protein
MTRIYIIIILDQNYLEGVELYKNIDKAKKSFNKHLRDRGLGLLARRKHLKEEFYRDGHWQIQLVKYDDKIE